MHTFQTVGRHRHGLVDVAEFLDGIRGDDVDQVHAPAVPLRAGIGRAVGDTLHLLQHLPVEAAQEERLRHGPAGLPGALLRFRIEARGRAVHVFDDLAREQMPVLVPALMGRALNVQVDPAADGILALGISALDDEARDHSVECRPVVKAGPRQVDEARHSHRRHVREEGPGGAEVRGAEHAAVARAELDGIVRARGHEAQAQTRPVRAASHRFRVNVEGHGRDGERGAAGDGRPA